MTGNSPPNEPDVNLSEEEKARIRAEVRYAIIAAKEARPPEQSKTTLEKIFSSSVFSLLLGAVLATGTGIISQKIQQDTENKNQQTKLSGELIEHFNLYSDTLDEEYMTVLNLGVKNKLTDKEYYDYLQKLMKITLQRNNEYAKIQTLAYLTDNKQISDAEKNLYSAYTNKINKTSDKIYDDLWKLYKETYKLKENQPNPDANYFNNLLSKDIDPLRVELRNDRPKVQALIVPQSPKAN